MNEFTQDSWLKFSSSLLQLDFQQYPLFSGGEERESSGHDDDVDDGYSSFLRLEQTFRMETDNSESKGILTQIVLLSLPIIGYQQYYISKKRKRG